MRKTNILLAACGLLLSSCLLCACGSNEPVKPDNPDNPDTPDTPEVPIYEQGDKKAVNGAGLLFFETMGFNTKDASIFEENNERYIVYAGQEEAKGAQVFAARKGTLKDGAWVYGEKKVILKGATGDSAWDKFIYQPSVVKGTFKYNTKDYKYLMAYQGNSDGSNFNNNIGLAVSNDILGSWERVGTAPLIKNPEIYEASYGFGSPILLNVDQKGSLLIAYSFGETLLSGERVKSLNALDLNAPVLESGYAELPTAGLVGRDDGIITNAGLALGKNNDFYIANDGMTSSNAPGNATSFEVAKAGSALISDVSTTWAQVKKVTGKDTIDPMKTESLGRDELCSADFVTDAYGRVDDTKEKLEIVYTSFNEGVGDAAFSGQLCSIEVAK